MQPPNIEAYVLPRLEMRFETFEEAKNFYNLYAKHASFAIREGSKFKTRAYILLHVLWSLSFEGVWSK